MAANLEFIPSQIILNSNILRLLEAIAKKQGELGIFSQNVANQFFMQNIAVVDAVHFSTKIEGNRLTRDQVTKALETKGLKPKNREMREILNYSKARRMVTEWALSPRPYDSKWVLVHHKQILEGIVKGKLRGYYREAQCVIQDSKTRGIVYMAPQWKDVPSLMDGLLVWLRRQFILGGNPLLVAAQFHFEFVTIHPFMDGNGRLGRLLTNGILLRGGYSLERYAALEKQNENSRNEYYHALRMLQCGNYYEIPRKQDITNWVIYWLECVLRAYDEALHRISGFTLQTQGLDIVEDLYSVTSKIRLERAKGLFRQHGSLRASEYADLMALGRTQAVEDLNSLVKIGYIKKAGGGRSTIYAIIKKSV